MNECQGVKKKSLIDKLMDGLIEEVGEDNLIRFAESMMDLPNFLWSAHGYPYEAWVENYVECQGESRSEE